MPAGKDGNIKLGDSDIDSFQLGGDQVEAIYLGTKEVWVFGATPVWTNIGTQTVGDNALNYRLDLNNFVSGKPGPTITVSGLPSGLTASNGVISGTTHNSQRGSHTITVTATNSIGSTQTTFTLQIVSLWTINIPRNVSRGSTNNFRFTLKDATQLTVTSTTGESGTVAGTTVNLSVAAPISGSFTLTATGTSNGVNYRFIITVFPQ